jgi:hypothetical protein
MYEKISKSYFENVSELCEWGTNFCQVTYKSLIRRVSERVFTMSINKIQAQYNNTKQISKFPVADKLESRCFEPHNCARLWRVPAEIY